MYGIAFMFPLSLAVVRYDVGPDWIHYLDQLNRIHEGREYTMVFGFVAIARLLGTA